MQMSARKPYPQWRKNLDATRERYLPWPSEAQFIKMMGRWWLLVNGFKHQFPIGPYRADFASPRLRVVIEVDGEGKVPKHDIIKIQDYWDAQAAREAYLLRAGWHVLHVRYYDIRNHPNRTRSGVIKWIKKPVQQLDI
jgi:very-short-patch-repair endonuclease